jgi:hypothetical protein
MKLHLPCNPEPLFPADMLYLSSNVPREQFRAAHFILVALPIPRAALTRSLSIAVPAVSRLSIIQYSIRLTDSNLLESDCTPTVKSFPVCADPSWVLYDGKSAGEHFCCQANEEGIYPGIGVGGVGLCVASDMSVAVTQTAFKVPSSCPLMIVMVQSSNNGF